VGGGNIEVVVAQRQERLFHLCFQFNSIQKVTSSPRHSAAGEGSTAPVAPQRITKRSTITNLT
jgi:hypothetical protein